MLWSKVLDLQGFGGSFAVGSLLRRAWKTPQQTHPVSASLFSPSTPAWTVFVSGFRVCPHRAILWVCVAVVRVFPP